MTTEKHSEKTKKSSRGGARANAGRRPGSTNKLSGEAILAAVSATLGVPYAEQLSQNYLKCIAENDKAMVAKYDQMFLNKVVADKTEVDLTTAGQAIIPTLVFQPARLPDWSNDPKD
jgi:hypothetical protein